MKSRPSKQSALYKRIFAIAIILTIAAGWMFTDHLGKIAENDFKERLDREANLIVSLINDHLEDADSASKTLNQAEAIIAALSSGSPADLERANRTLDRYKSNLEMSACFLLDRNGLDVASADRNTRSGFVGKSYAFRPYLKGALAGRLTRYFAISASTSERGYYAAAPSVDSSGAIIGVVVIKKDIAPLEEIFKKYPHVFLVSPEGIIFISSMEKLLFRALWPVDEKKRTELLASKQFGNIRFEPLLAAEPRKGTYVMFDKSEHYVQRLPYGSDGWTLVSMEHPGIVTNYRLFGILLTIVFGLLLLFFYYVLRNKEKSLEAAGNILKAREDWGRTFDAVPDLIAIIDTGNRILRMNRKMAERLGISPQDAIGRRCHELLNCAKERSTSCPHKKMLVSGKTETETLFQKKLNAYFIVTAAPILTEDGTIESSVLVMHDITELKRLEISQKEYAQRLEFVLDGSNDATWEWDMLTNQVLVNMRYYELMEYAPVEADMNFAFIMNAIHPDDVSEVQRLIQRNLDGKSNGYEAQFRLITKSGTIRQVIGRGKVVVHDEDGRPTRMAGVTTDITEHKRLSDEVNRLHNLESIGILVGGLAHDFNNLLNIIYGNITFAKMLSEGDTSIAEPLKDAEEACERAKELGIRLKSFSHGDSPVKEAIMLPDVIEEAAGALFKGSNISYTISAADDLLPVEADQRQTRLLFDNLLTNAKESMYDGGTIRIDIDYCAVEVNKGLPLESGHYLRIAILDNGKGIPEEHLPKIFDPYFSSKDAYGQRGMGLGLSICHAILKKHNGHITVESELGVGTRVTVYLPASTEETIT